MTNEENMSLRALDAAEHEALALRVQKTWAALRANNFAVDLPLPSLLQGFGDWRRVSGPVSESYGRTVCLLFRNGATDEYAVLSLPDSPEEAVQESDMNVVLDAARTAVVGDFMDVWRWALTTSPQLTSVALLLSQRLPSMDETVQFLSAFTLTEDTFREAAQDILPRLVPLPSATRGAVDLMFWEATEEARRNVTDWATQEVERFLSSRPNQEVAENEDALRVEVEALVETFIEEQFDFDPLGLRRVDFEWGHTTHP